MKLLQQQTFSYRYFVPSLRIGAENVVTDRQTDRTSTVTLAAYACWGLITHNVRDSYIPSLTYKPNPPICSHFHSQKTPSKTGPGHL